MAVYRSKSYADGRYPHQHEMQLEKSSSYAGSRPDPHDFRSNSYAGPRPDPNDFRSNSYAGPRADPNDFRSYSYAGPRPDPNDFRSYSASYASSSTYDHPGPYSGQGPTQLDQPGPNIEKLKKGGSVSAKNWILTDPELQRKRRVASYKAYGVEGKVKGGFKKSFRWLKDRYNLVIHGWR